MQHNKPIRPQDALGLDVKLSRETLEQDTWAKNMLEEIGKTLTRAAGPDFTYMGSLAIHFCRTTGDLAGSKYEIANVMQWETGDMNEAVINTGLANMLIEFKRQMGRRHNTTDQRDKRGEGNT